MSNVVSLDEYRLKKAPKATESGDGIHILLGAESGSICPHCGNILYHAMAMPHANQGKACRNCDIWFDGDLYS